MLINFNIKIESKKSKLLIILPACNCIYFIIVFIETTSLNPEITYLITKLLAYLLNTMTGYFIVFLFAQEMVGGTI